MATPSFSFSPTGTRVSTITYGNDYGFGSLRGTLAVKSPAPHNLESPRREPPNLQGLTDIVEVLIGPDNISWKLHRDLLIADSATAKAMLTGGFQESISQRAIFSELEVDGFAMYATYLYTNSLPPSTTTTNKTNHTLDRLLKAYIAGDYLVSPRFQDLTFRAIFALVASPASPSPPLTARQIDYIMENTSPRCPLRRFTADVVGAAILRKQYRFADEGAVVSSVVGASPLGGPLVISAEWKGDMLDGVLNALKLLDFRGGDVVFGERVYLPHSGVAGGGSAVATVEAGGRKDEHVDFSFGTWRV